MVVYSKEWWSMLWYGGLWYSMVVYGMVWWFIVKNGGLWYGVVCNLRKLPNDQRLFVGGAGAQVEKIQTMNEPCFLTKRPQCFFERLRGENGKLKCWFC